MRARTHPCGLAVPLLLAAAGALMGPTPPATAETLSEFAGEPQFQQRLTVRVSGMPLDQLLPEISRELGVTLRPGSTTIGDIRVAVFAEELPAHRTLTALTRMLNLTPERGFTWEKQQGKRTAYTLTQSVRSRTQAAQRLRDFHREEDTRLLQRIAAMRQDPKLQQRGGDATPMTAPFGRAPYLISILSDTQLRQLLQEGHFVLRYPAASPLQQQALARMAPDLIRGVQRFGGPAPGTEPRYRDLNPAEFTLVLTLERKSTEPVIKGFFRCGPNKAIFRNQILPIPPGPVVPASDPVSEDVPTPGAERIELRPRTWSMAEVLSEIARRTRKPLVSDCYLLSWHRLRALGPATLPQIQARIDQLWGVEWDLQDGYVLARSRTYYARQPWEVPERLVAAWLDEIRADSRLRLDTLARFAELSEGQLTGLEFHPELQETAPEVYGTPIFFNGPLRLYGLLSPVQRRRVHTGGLQLEYREMPPAMRHPFHHWLLENTPHIPEDDYAEANLRMAYSPEGHFQLHWKAGSVTQSFSSWLDIRRDWLTGELQTRETDVPAHLAGKTAPAAAVRSPDDEPATLPGEAKPFRLLLFRSPWLTPTVSAGEDGADLRKLESLLTAHPQLRGSIGVVCPFFSPAEVKAWAAERKLKLPCYADPDGSAARAYGALREPRAVLLNAARQVTRVLSGYREILDADWGTLLR